MNKREIFSIPNLMSYFRILLIPFIIWKFLGAEKSTDYWIAAGLVGLSGLTDFFDGRVARKFNMVTELGKLLDPVADKLTLGTIIFCFTMKYPILWIIAGLYIIKEGYMGIMGILLLRRNKRKLDGAKWYGKICTASLYLAMFLLLIFPDMPFEIVIALTVLCFGIMAFTLIAYMLVFREMWKMERKET